MRVCDIHMHQRICVSVCVICAHHQMCRLLYFFKRVFLLVPKLCSLLYNKCILHFEDKLWCFAYGATGPSGPGPPHFWDFMVTLIHTTFIRTSLDEWSARRRDLYLKTNSTHKTYQCPKRDSNLRCHWDL